MLIPYSVFFEITRACNFGCRFCPSSRGPTPERLTAAEVERALGELSGLGFRGPVQFHLLGEPLLHPEHRRIFAAARRLGLPTVLITNGSLLGPHRAYLAESIDRLYVSVINRDLASRAPAGGLGWREYVAGLAGFLSSLPTGGTPRVIFRLAAGRNPFTRRFQIAAGTMALAEELLAAAGASVSREQLGGGEELVPVNSRVAIEYFELIDWNPAGKKYAPRFGHCPVWPRSRQLAVLADGSVGLCCLDYHGGTAIGNLRRSGWRQLLTDPALSAIAADFAAGRLSRAVCRQCRGANNLPRLAARKLNDWHRARCGSRSDAAGAERKRGDDRE